MWPAISFCYASHHCVPAARFISAIQVCWVSEPIFSPCVGKWYFPSEDLEYVPERWFNYKQPCWGLQFKAGSPPQQPRPLPLPPHPDPPLVVHWTFKWTSFKSFKWSFLLALENISQNISWDKEDHHIQKIQSSPAYHNALDARLKSPSIIQHLREQLYTIR